MKTSQVSTISKQNLYKKYNVNSDDGKKIRGISPMLKNEEVLTPKENELNKEYSQLYKIF